MAEVLSPNAFYEVGFAVQTSVVKKSAMNALQCARRIACHDVDRSPLGGIPCSLRIAAMVDRATR